MELNYALTRYEAQEIAFELAEEAMSLVRGNRETVLNLIESGRVNANDTIYTEEAASPEEWASIFQGSIGTLLSTGEYNRHVVAWFARRGIKA